MAASLVTSCAILGGLGLLFGLLIALAERRFRVATDPRVAGALARLPGSNCGACGFAGCQGFAEGLIQGAARPAGCTSLGAEQTAELARFLGVEAGEKVVRVARLLCAGGRDAALLAADYVGHPTCAAAATVGSGGKACSFGCLGLADCARACTFDAIAMNADLLPLVDPALCTACGDCVETCPKELFVIMPVAQKLIVQCRSLLAGAAAERTCSVACTGCERCAADAAPGLIEIREGLARIDYRWNDQAAPAATARCPTGAIQWVEGAQRLDVRPAAAGARVLAGAGRP